MTSRIKKLLLKFGYTVTAIVLSLYIFKYGCSLSSLIECIEMTSAAVGYSMFPLILYEKILWKWDPFVKMPRLKKTYIGKLRSTYSEEIKEKKVVLEINQSYLSALVKMKTNEITSKTITSEIIEENGEYVLYYTYQTQPKSEYSKGNPIQIGTCKLNILNKTELEGVYWTSRKTTGDLVLKAKI